MSVETIVEPNARGSAPLASTEYDQTVLTTRLEGDAVLVCSGELDLVTTPALRRSLDRVLRLAPDRVVVDLSRVSFFDAGAISEFVRARNACRAAGSDFVVRSPSPFGRRLLNGVGLANLIVAEPAYISDPHDPSSALRGHVAELVTAWETACATARYGAASLGFDSTAVLEALTTLIDDPSSADRSAAESSLAALRADETSSATAVMQLWALRDVLYSWIETNHGVAMGSEHKEDESVDLPAALAALAESAVAELERATLLDPLTGLLNRRALDRDLVQSLAAANRRRQFLSVVMIDVEGLKAINDQSGHAAGDDTLRGVARSLTLALRAGDNAYRIGGDEFVLLLPELQPDDVDSVMERTTLGADGAFTWGCACVKCDDRATPFGEQATHLLELADQRMLDYRARVRGGRGRADGSLDSIPAPVGPSVELAGRFSAANRSNVVIEEAKGLIAEHLGVGIPEAATILRAFSTAQQQPMLAAAAALVDRTIAVDLLAPLSAAEPAGADGDTEQDAHVAARPRRN